MKDDWVYLWEFYELNFTSLTSEVLPVADTENTQTVKWYYG